MIYGILLILVLCIILLVDSLTNVFQSDILTKEKCTYHDWVRKGEGEYTYLVCNKCKYLAGSDQLFEERE